MTSQGTEFEIKSRLDPVQYTRIAGTVALGPAEKIVDEYLDTPERSLFLNAVFLRIRNGSLIEVKHNEGIESLDHLMSRDLKYPYPLTMAAHESLQAQVARLVRHTTPTTGFQLESLVPFVNIARTRREGQLEGVQVSLDDVDGLGTFVELEVRDATAVPQLRNLAIDLGLKNLPIGYVELYLRLHDFGLYQRGRFVMPGDRA